MNSLHKAGTILAATFSVIFAGLLFPEIVGAYGVTKSMGFTLIGVGFIWFVYFMLGILFQHLYEVGINEDRESKTDIV